MRLVNQETGQTLELPKKAYLRAKVVMELSNEGSLTTVELKEKVASSGCFEACRKLEAMGILESSLDRKYTLWDPVTGQVITRENHDTIVGKVQKERERLTKSLKEEGKTDEEIAQALSDMIDPRSLEVSYRTWWLSEKWKPVQ
jgi:hypothetical protein